MKAVVIRKLKGRLERANGSLRSLNVSSLAEMLAGHMSGRAVLVTA